MPVFGLARRGRMGCGATLSRVTTTAFALLAVSFLEGCASTPVTIAPKASFNAAMARQRLEPGSNGIAGKVLLRLSSGGALTCGGGVARLIPVTPYAEEWSELTYYQQPSPKGTPPELAYLPKSPKPPKEVQVNPVFLATTRQVVCDRDGQFRMDQIADGDYFLEADLVWQQDIYDEIHFFYGRNYLSKEGTVLKRFHIQGGKTLFLDLQWNVTNQRFNF